MSNTVFPTLQSSNWKMTRTPQWNTQVQTSTTRERTRAPLQTHPLWKWTLKNGILQSAPTIADLQAIQNLYNAMRGRFDFFLWQDPEGASIVDPSVQINILGQYYWPVAFTQDSFDFDRFAYQLWECGTLEFEQVGFPSTLFNNLQQPHGGIVSATLTVRCSFIPGDTYQAFADLSYNGNPQQLLFNGASGFYFSQAAFGVSDITVPVTAVPQWVNCGIDGTLFGSGLNEFLIYDCSVTVAYEDLTVLTVKPTSTRQLLTSQGAILDAANAVDGDSSTFATIQRSTFTSLANPIFLQLVF